MEIKSFPAKMPCCTRPAGFFAVLLKISCPCYLGISHVEENARHVKDFAAMLEVMPVMLEI
jgi:hypothetical protein